MILYDAEGGHASRFLLQNPRELTKNSPPPPSVRPLKPLLWLNFSNPPENSIAAALNQPGPVIPIHADLPEAISRVTIRYMVKIYEAGDYLFHLKSLVSLNSINSILFMALSFCLALFFLRDSAFFRKYFSRDIWLHSSSWLDYRFFAINGVIMAALLNFTLISVQEISDFLGAWMSTWLPPMEKLESTSANRLFRSVIVILVTDLSFYLIHYWFHRYRIPWEFHKIHHSATRLTPITANRIHPVDIVSGICLTTLMLGVTYSLFSLVFASPFDSTAFYGVNVFAVLYIAFGPLRHSHVPLNYPKWLSLIYVSPYQHQFHHVKITEIPNLDTSGKTFSQRNISKVHQVNLGIIFSFWDLLFGTYHYPESVSKLTFNNSGESETLYSSVWRLYWIPFKRLIQRALP